LVARHLIEETGTELENQHATEFRCSILTGDWSKAIAALENLRPEISRDDKVQVWPPKKCENYQYSEYDISNLRAKIPRAS